MGKISINPEPGYDESLKGGDRIKPSSDVVVIIAEICAEVMVRLDDLNDYLEVVKASFYQEKFSSCLSAKVEVIFTDPFNNKEKIKAKWSVRGDLADEQRKRDHVSNVIIEVINTFNGRLLDIKVLHDEIRNKMPKI